MTVSVRGAREAVKLTLSVALGLSVVVGSAWASRWTEESFVDRVPVRYPLRSSANRLETTVVGDLRTYVVEEGDTLLDVGRHFDLGYNEMISANPGVDPWMPSPAEVIVIPTEFVLPEARSQGVVVNIPEMRLYHYQGRTQSASAATTGEPQRAASRSVARPSALPGSFRSRFEQSISESVATRGRSLLGATPKILLVSSVSS